MRDCESSPARTLSRLRPVVILIVALSGAVAQAQQNNYSNAAFNDLNGLFRAAYAEARDARLAAASPVIIARGDSLLLLRAGESLAGSTVSSNYHDLKAIAHIPLALFCILGPGNDEPLTARQTEQLTELSQAVTAVAEALPDAFADERQRTRQIKVVASSQKFVDQVVRQQRCTAGELDDLLDQLRPAILANTGDAVRLRLDNYHRQMQKWRQALTAAEWSRLKVIIPGATMPRSDSLAVAYFAKIFEQGGESDRVIYAESRFAQEQALQLLGTHLLDSSIGQAFFDDASRMRRDLLGPAADAYLDTLDFEAFRQPAAAAAITP